MTLEEVFSENGFLAKQDNSYEIRPQQVEMAETIQKGIIEARPVMVEGPTGIGKSFAYLIPLLLTGEKFIVSTSNKSLQDQLDKKDLPYLYKMFKGDLGEFDWTSLKGRNNYFCFEHFQANQEELLNYLTPLEIQKIEEWANKDETGDLEYYPEELTGKVRELISCSIDTVHDKESMYYNLCFAQKARNRADDARIVLVNHTLLGTNLSILSKTDGIVRILPKVKYIVVDEAHGFEKMAMLAFSDSINRFSLSHLLSRNLIKKAVSKVKIKDMLDEMDKVLAVYLPTFDKERGYFTQQKWQKFDGFSNLIEMLKSYVIKAIDTDDTYSATAEEKSNSKQVRAEATNLISRLQELEEADDSILKWSEAQESKMDTSVIITLKYCPVSIANLLRNYLYNDAIVFLTSATLSVHNDFTFFKYQLGTPENIIEKQVESPFDYRTKMLVYTTNGEMNAIDEVQELLEASKGRAFVLFTSYKDMNYFYNWVKVPYPKLVQSSDMSRSQILEKFKTTENAVLFATKSFWEGVDIPGDQLSLVIIHKIPFGNPSDLLYSTKVEQIDKELGAGTGWRLYSVPDACLALKQGVGRLIRRKSDKGVVALLDSRIMTKNYGKQIILSFPEQAHKTQRLTRVKEFFGRE